MSRFHLSILCLWAVCRLFHFVFASFEMFLQFFRCIHVLYIHTQMSYVYKHVWIRCEKWRTSRLQEAQQWRWHGKPGAIVKDPIFPSSNPSNWSRAYFDIISHISPHFFIANRHDIPLLSKVLAIRVSKKLSGFLGSSWFSMQHLLSCSLSCEQRGRKNWTKRQDSKHSWT